FFGHFFKRKSHCILPRLCPVPLIFRQKSHFFSVFCRFFIEKSTKTSKNGFFSKMTTFFGENTMGKERNRGVPGERPWCAGGPGGGGAPFFPLLPVTRPHLTF